MKNEIKIKSTIVPEEVLMKDAYSETLRELAREDDRIVALDSDLANSMSMVAFFEEFPTRGIDCGIQEANMIGMAAGLSVTGKIPYTHTFAPFATRRVMDQVFISAAYAKLNVKMIGSDPGITAAFNGGTHMPFEDMAVMLSIPGVTVLEPSDAVMLKDLVRQVKDIYGLQYIRVQRKNADGIYEEGSKFEIGKGITVKDGSDVTIIASGIMVSEAIKAAETLATKGISARVVDMFTWKPIDEELIEKCVKETGAIVTAENHNCTCGLGSAVARVCSQKCPAPIEYVGINDEFGEVGPQNYLAERYHLRAEDIVEKALKAISRK